MLILVDKKNNFVINTDFISHICYDYDHDLYRCKMIGSPAYIEFRSNFNIKKLAEFVPIIDIETGENIYQSEGGEFDGRC